MATPGQQKTDWRELEWLDDHIELVLRFLTKIAEVILLIGVGYAGYKMTVQHSNEVLDRIWIISQILALDLSAPGLFAMAKHAKDAGQQSRADWAQRIAITLVVMSILSMVEGAAEYFFRNIDNNALTICSFTMMIARCAAAVGYSVFCRLQKASRVQADQTAQPQPSPVGADPPVPPVDLTPLLDKITQLTDQVEKLQSERITDTVPTLEETQNGHSTDTQIDTGDDTETDTPENTNNITLLSSRRTNQRTRGDTKTHTANSSDKASRAKRHIRKNPQIGATELAQKANISVTYARKLLAQKEA